MIKIGMKLICTILMCLIVINIVSVNNKIFASAHAADTGGGTSSSGVKDVIENPNYWKPVNKVIGNAGFKEKINIIVTMVRTIGIMVSVITLSIIGIKYMLGSLEDRAQYKQTLIPWLIGAIFVFAITTVPTLIFKLVAKN